MPLQSYQWTADGLANELRLVPVAGTGDHPYLFGRSSPRLPISISPFYISTTPVTRALWLKVTGANPSQSPGLKCPVDKNWNLHCTISWRYGITPEAHDGCIGFRLVLAKG
jgi:hypothetical protein